MSETGNISGSRLATTVTFFGSHLACEAAFFTGINADVLIVGAALYAARMFGITAGYHRYFSHRSFKTGRVFQFILAWLAMSSGQKSVVWWAAHHRHHHRHSDTEHDVHSPITQGFWWSHVGWILSKTWEGTDETQVKDLLAFPELRWLHRHQYLPVVSLGVLVWLIFGWSGLVVGFFWSTVATWHATFAINSLAHVWGSRRFDTRDGSRNNALLAFFMFGEGWHNNHHRYPGSARQGFLWWELDISWLVLRGLRALGVVWELREPPASLLRRSAADNAIGAAHVGNRGSESAAIGPAHHRSAA
jgi:stearoyl-CoA desaturase (delta-9 desaturase)